MPPIIIDPTLRFLVSVPDWEAIEATPFQGFAPSLCRNHSLVSFINHMPANVTEFTPEYLPYLIHRRIAGQSPVSWYGQSPRALRSFPMPVEAALTVILLDESESVSDYREWLATCRGPVTLVAKDGPLPYSELSFPRLKERYLEVCAELRQLGDVQNVDDIERAIQSWTKLPERKLATEIRGHGTIAPNAAALRSCGFVGVGVEPFRQIHDKRAYIDQIVKTTNAIFDEREAHPPSAANQLYPRRPDLNIYLPATYDLQTAFQFRPDLDPPTRRGVEASIRMLERQVDYKFDATTDAQIKALTGISTDELSAGGRPRPNIVMGIRQLELWLGTEAVSCLSASEISAVVRPPNRLNRTRGAVRQFAQHYRADRPQFLRRSEMFRGVQRAIAEGLPDDFKALIARSQDGIRVIADAHIEWLDIEGIPLALRHDVSRIPVTPGNLFIEQLAVQPEIQATPESFRDVLIISGLEDTDIIAQQFTVAFDTFGKQWGDKLNVRTVRVRSRKEFVDAINAFDGMMMVFDGHGSHRPDQPGVLWFGAEPVDVWHLRGEIGRPPPIVILSACDTHAADRNHATVANGFLALGSRSVLGSVFPLHASHAAMFVARLLYRVSDYVPAAIKGFKRTVTWMEVVSGMLRVQASTDMLRHFLELGLIKEEDFLRLHHNVSELVNIGRMDPFGPLRQSLIEHGIEEARLDREIHAAIASSSTISYLHLGRPETILINSDDNIREFIASEDEGADRA